MAWRMSRATMALLFVFRKTRSNAVLTSSGTLKFTVAIVEKLYKLQGTGASVEAPPEALGDIALVAHRARGRAYRRSWPP